MITFNHSGKIGDILYSLYFCKELSEAANNNKFNFHIQTNIKEKNGFGGMSIKDYEFMKLLLEKQNYINELTYSDDIPNQEIFCNLNNIRSLPVIILAKDIRSWYYHLLSNHLPKNFYKPIIQVEPNDKFKDKIILTYTFRYKNTNINYDQIKEFANNLIFMGTENEYEQFKNIYFDLQFKKCENMLEIAQYMAGAGGVIGNPGGLYALAECLKVPRILLSPQYFHPNGLPEIKPGPINVYPIGGWNEYVFTNLKLYYSVIEMLTNMEKKNA